MIFFIEISSKNILNNFSERNNMADMSHLPIVAGLFLFVFLTWRDLSGTEQTSHVQKDIKAPKLAQFATPTIKFLYWYCRIFMLTQIMTIDKFYTFFNFIIYFNFTLYLFQ